MGKRIYQSKTRVPKNDKFPPGKITNYDSEMFYSESVPFLNKRRLIHRSGATIFRCSKCGLWLRGDHFTGYCSLQKRMTEASETCEVNTHTL